jgi:hypothetical protein
MKPVLRQLALAGLFVLGAGSASAAVKVTYKHPEKFADLPFSSWDREQTLAQFTDYFNKLAKALPPGQDMDIEVLDIDLAGREHPGARSGRDIRVLRGGADWPSIHLKYSLLQNGAVLKSGDAQLKDMNYMYRLPRYSDGDPLRYEKQMIDEWFAKTIGPAYPKK